MQYINQLLRLVLVWITLCVALFSCERVLCLACGRSLFKTDWSTTTTKGVDSGEIGGDISLPKYPTPHPPSSLDSFNTSIKVLKISTTNLHMVSLFLKSCKRLAVVLNNILSFQLPNIACFFLCCLERYFEDFFQMRVLEQCHHGWLLYASSYVSSLLYNYKFSKITDLITS